MPARAERQAADTVPPKVRGLYRRSDSGIWYFAKMVAGKRKVINLMTTDFDEALEASRQFRAGQSSVHRPKRAIRSMSIVPAIRSSVPIRALNPMQAAAYVGGAMILRAYVTAGWVKPYIQRKRCTRYDLRSLDQAIDRHQADKPTTLSE